MTLTILYWHPDRPDEAGMTMIADQAKVSAIVDRLENRGFVIDKITARSSPSAAATADTPRLGTLGPHAEPPSDLHKLPAPGR
jgi:hypothetical protein